MHYFDRVIQFTFLFIHDTLQKSKSRQTFAIVQFNKMLPKCKEVFGRSGQLLLNNFFDPGTLYVRKGSSGEEKTDENSARTTTAGTPHARAKKQLNLFFLLKNPYQHNIMTT